MQHFFRIRNHVWFYIAAIHLFDIMVMKKSKNCKRIASTTTRIIYSDVLTFGCKKGNLFLTKIRFYGMLECIGI